MILILITDSTDEGLKKAKSGSDEEPYITGVVQLIKIRNRSSREKNRRTGYISVSDSVILSALIYRSCESHSNLSDIQMHVYTLYTYIHTYTHKHTYTQTRHT